MSRPSSADRLSRLLAIVPWVVAHDGPEISEVCDRFGVSERELVADLNLLFMCGLYPYTPDSLIEVDIDAGRVWVRFAEWFRRPLRLTPPEGLALLATARAMLGVPGPGEGRPEEEPNGATPGAMGHDGRSPLASAVAKLEMVLGGGGEETLDVELGAASPGVLATLQAAAEGGRKTRLEYYSFGRDQTGERVVQPWRVFSSEGHWYLLAWCESAGDKRLFRVDRVRWAVALDECFEPPPDIGPIAIYEPGPADPVVVLELAPSAHWVIEGYPHEGTEQLGGGWVRVRLRASSRAWLERLLLRAGPDAVVVEGAPGVAAEAARRVLAVYGHVTSRE